MCKVCRLDGLRVMMEFPKPKDDEEQAAENITERKQVCELGLPVIDSVLPVSTWHTMTLLACRDISHPVHLSKPSYFLLGEVVSHFEVGMITPNASCRS